MIAYILVRVPAPRSGGIVEILRSWPEIKEAHVIYGESDIIAKVEVPNNRTLDELVINRIQSLDKVESTRTFLVIELLESKTHNS